MRVLLCLPLALLACTAGPEPTGTGASVAEEDRAAAPRVITTAAELDGAVGALVTLVGVQTRSKIPTVLGVDVDGAHELSDRRVRVTGVLRRHVVPDRPADPDEPVAASRGPGTYHFIVDPATGRLARPELDE